MTVVLIGTALLLSVYMVVNIPVSYTHLRAHETVIPTVIWRITVKEFPVAYV